MAVRQRIALFLLGSAITGDLAAQEKFWADASARLGRLYRLTDRDLDEIESLLMKRVAKPLPQAVHLGKVTVHDQSAT